jgi:hypothetical protein
MLAGAAIMAKMVAVVLSRATGDPTGSRACSFSPFT